MPNWNDVGDALREHGLRGRPDCRPTAVGGGSICATWRYETLDGPIFLKTGNRDAFGMLSTEALGLQEIAASEAIRVPNVLAIQRCEQTSVLALEWLILQPAGHDCDEELGTQLAALHRHSNDQFGWQQNNWIGLTPQANTISNDWAQFYAAQRLAFQFDLAERNGYQGALLHKAADLMTGITNIFDGHSPSASLLHGDLWSGNRACCDEHPVIFDPAVYYGDRESDLAMSRLFGGFHAEFYAAYEEAWPMADGHQRRCALYQLYHVLNHLNLFGASYYSQAVSLINELLQD